MLVSGRHFFLTCISGLLLMGLGDDLITASLFITLYQYTSINGLNSDLTNIYGVPKVFLGRLFFLTYISGLVRAIKYSKVHHFADDTSMDFRSSIKLVNKQVNDNFKVNSLTYIANGCNGNENLVTVRSSSFEYKMYELFSK